MSSLCLANPYSNPPSQTGLPGVAGDDSAVRGGEDDYNYCRLAMAAGQQTSCPILSELQPDWRLIAQSTLQITRLIVSTSSQPPAGNIASLCEAKLKRKLHGLTLGSTTTQTFLGSEYTVQRSGPDPNYNRQQTGRVGADDCM